MPVNWWPDEMATAALEPDIKRLAALVEMFKEMDPAERRRALNYLDDRFAEDE